MSEWWTDPRIRSGWKGFERMVRSKLASIGDHPKAYDGHYDWERLLREALRMLEQMPPSGLTHEVFETFRSVFVRVQLPNRQEPLYPDVVVQPRAVIVSGIPGKLDETIPLPADVIARGRSVAYANGVLEIRLRKRTVDKPSRRYGSRSVRNGRPI